MVNFITFVNYKHWVFVKYSKCALVDAYNLLPFSFFCTSCS